MKKALSLVLCFVMIFTAIPFSVTAFAEGENHIKELALQETLTLFRDSYHENDSAVLTAEKIGENEGEPITDEVSIDWRSSKTSVAVVETNPEDDSTVTVRAVGYGTANIVAEVRIGEEVRSASCKVTVRESILVALESFNSNMNDIPSDIDDTDPVKYSDTALAQLKIAFSEIQNYFNDSEVNKPFLEWRDELVALVGNMEDTEDNINLINNWKKGVRAAVSSVENSVLALPDNDEYWAAWKEAYALMPPVPVEMLEGTYTEESAKAVKDIIEEYRSTQWIDNDACRKRINELAVLLTEAVANLKEHTTKLSFEKDVIIKNYGAGTFKIPYTIVGDDPIKWYSTDGDIVSVDQFGWVTIKSAVPEGYNKEIRVFAVSNNITASCEIKILNPVSYIEVSQRLAVLMDAPKQLVVDIFGADNSCPVTEAPVLEYVSDNETVATVSEDGIITGVAKGDCYITVSVKNNTLVEPVRCKISVSPALKVSKLAVVSLPTQVTVNAVAEAKLYVHPTDAVNKTIKWTSSDEKIATVESVTTDSNSYATAIVRGIKPGSTLITYETTDGSNIKGSFTVTVNPLVAFITFDKISITTYVDSDEKLEIKATCQPINAGNQKLSWISSDEDVATVVDGKIKIVKTGTCEITAIAQDGSGTRKSATLIVLGSARTMTMSSAPSKMNTGEKIDLDCTVVTKQDVTYEVRDWSVDDKELASVNSDGVVTALRPGKVTVTARYFDGTTRTKAITIIAPLDGISLSEKLTLEIGKTKALVPTYKPEYASNKAVTWTTSDRSVVSVSTEGVLTAAGTGTAVITVKSEEGGYVATCKVTVIQPVTGVSLNKTSATLVIGKTDSVKLKPTVRPENATTKTVTWKSSNTKVATVSSSGIVTAKGPGVATITCTTASGGFTATCKVTVRQPVKGIKFSSSKLTYYIGQKKGVTIIFTPANASNKGLTYKSSDKSIATISEKGVVKALKKGTCTLTAISDDGNYKATCTLKVTKKIDVEDIDIVKSSTTVNAGKTKQLLVDIYPFDASVKDVKWTTSDKTIATVNSEGVVTGHKGGIVVIKCTSLDTGVSDKCKVTVYEPVKSVKISADSATLVAGSTKILTADVSPSTASNQDITWYSTNKAVATVDKNGKVTAVKGGTCNIAAKSKDNEKLIAKCKLTVIQPPTKITLSDNDAELLRGDKIALTATVKPKDCYDSTVKWTSSDSLVARVNDQGIVTAVTAGTCVIKCSSVADPSVKSTCNITVFQPVTGVSLTTEKLTLVTGRTKTLVVNVEPAKASNKKVTFRTSDKDVVKVSSKGVVEAIGPGQATVTVRTDDGFYTAKCVITVIEPVSGVKLDKTSTSIELGKSKTLTATVSPKKATNKDVTWRSSNPLVARVTQSGKVTAIAEGTAVITCTTEDGGFKATCKVSCIIPVESVTLKDTSVTIKKGSTKTLKPVIYPEYATNQAVTWTSSDPTIAKVDKNGVVTAVKKGACFITCTTKQGKKKVTCIVSVK